MDILGVGPLELMLILILALVIFGPDKLPQIGSKLGQSLRDMRKATREFSKEIEETRQIFEAPADVFQDISEPFKEAGAVASGARDLLTNPSKAIGDYVMGQYAAGEGDAQTAVTGDKGAVTETSAAAEATAVATDTDPVVAEALAAMDRISFDAAEAPAEVTATALPMAETPADVVAEATSFAPIITSEPGDVPADAALASETVVPVISAAVLPVFAHDIAPVSVAAELTTVVEDVAATTSLAAELPAVIEDVAAVSVAAELPAAVEDVAATSLATELPVPVETTAMVNTAKEPLAAADCGPDVIGPSPRPTPEIKPTGRAARGEKRHHTAPRQNVESALTPISSGETETMPVHLVTED